MKQTELRPDDKALVQIVFLIVLLLLQQVERYDPNSAFMLLLHEAGSTTALLRRQGISQPHNMIHILSLCRSNDTLCSVVLKYFERLCPSQNLLQHLLLIILCNSKALWTAQLKTPLKK